MSLPPLLEVRGVTRIYSAGGVFRKLTPIVAVDDVWLTVGEGTIHGIVGESGCGKSTLARILVALDGPTTGQVLLAGNSLHELPAPALARMRKDFQMVFQDPYGSLDPRQRVGTIVAEPLHVLVPRPNAAERGRRVDETLASVGLTPRDRERYPHEFSGGQRQRIAIARALSTRPKLIVADEAISALDLSVQAQVLNLLMDLTERDGLTMVFISHNLSAVGAIADEVSVMHRGRIVETGAAAMVLDRPLHPYTRELAEAEPSIDKLGPSPRPDEAAAPEAEPAERAGCLFRHRCPLASAICVTERPALRPIAPGRLSACHHAERLT